MKKLISLVLVTFIFLLLIPMGLYAADQTPNINAAASRIEAQNTSIEVYPTDKIDYDNPWINLTRVTIIFKNEDQGSVYRNAGDIVNFFIKSSGSNEIGWVDKNDNDDYESGEEMNAALGSNTGFYAKGIRLNRGGTVTFYIGSRIPGSPEIKVYTDNNGIPETLIGTVHPKIAAGKGSLIMTAFDEKGKPLSGNSGSISDHFKLDAGVSVELQAALRSGGLPVEGKTVTFRKAVGIDDYSIIRTVITDADGIASIEHKSEKAGFQSYQVSAEGFDSRELFFEYSPGRPGYVELLTADEKLLVKNDEYEIRARVTDDYGNPIFSNGEKVVEFSVGNTPEFSKYFGFSGAQASTDRDGIAVFKFTPDRLGKYRLRCQSINKRGSDYIDVEAVSFSKATSLRFTLVKGEEEIPAVQYTESKIDGSLQFVGRLMVKRVNAAGAEVIVKGSDVHNLTFISSNPDAVVIDADGDIAVKDKNYSGVIKVSVTDNKNSISGEYTLKVVGPPASIRPTARVNGKKAEIILRYIDHDGNDTYYLVNEEYKLKLPATGLATASMLPFNKTGKATFLLLADEYKEYSLSVSAGRSLITKTFQVQFKPALVAKPIIGARRVNMFIGMAGYTQDGVAKVTDVPPFIKDGRTFVAVRPIGDAFGASIDWNDATQTVVLTRPDMTVTIVIGSSRITAVKDGVTTVITADVPAFIQDGRTVLPFRAVGDAFGVLVSYDAATQAVGYSQ